MKKMLSVCLVFVMVICFSVTVFAEGGFVSSPSLNPSPEIVEGDGDIVINSYADRDKLSDEERKDIEDAYDSIKNNENLVDLNEKLNNAADNKNVDPSNLAVSDLFNIGYKGNDPFSSQSLTLKADTLNNFVALMVYVNGEWQLVEDATIKNGNLLFTAKELGAYAVVVNTGDDTKSPQTGINETEADNSGIAVYGILMVVSACGALLMWNKSKKYTA